MLKKFSLCLVAVIFFFSTSATVNAEPLYNGSPESLLSALQKVAAEHKIKLWGIEKNDSEINVNYGSSELNQITIFSSHNFSSYNKSKSVSFVSLSVDLQESEKINGIDGDFLGIILKQSGASSEEIQKLGIEMTAHFSDIAKRVVNNKSVSSSKLKKTFKINCSSNNKIIFIKSNIHEEGSLFMIISTSK